jgi:hypothetical protein
VRWLQPVSLLQSDKLIAPAHNTMHRHGGWATWFSTICLGDYSHFLFLSIVSGWSIFDVTIFQHIMISKLDLITWLSRRAARSHDGWHTSSWDRKQSAGFCRK